MELSLFNDSDIVKMIDNFDNTFNYMECEKRKIAKLLPERVRTLKKNICDIIQILYEKGQACLVEVDTSLENERVELGGMSCGIGRILDILKNKGVVEKSAYPYRLKRKYENAIDSICLKSIFS